MQGTRAAGAADRPAEWIIRTGGLAWREGGTGIAISAIAAPGGGTRLLVRRAEAGLSLELELEAAIGGFEAAFLDAALSVAPQDAWGVELRTRSERLIDMIATHDIWTDPAREGANPGFAALRPAFMRMAALIGRIQDMGGTVAVTRVGHSAEGDDDRRFAAQAQHEFDRHLRRRELGSGHCPKPCAHRPWPGLQFQVQQ